MKAAQRLATLLLVGLLATSAWTQGAPPEPRAGEGRIQGRLVDSRGVGASEAEVVLYALTTGGEAGLRRTTSDAAGRFAFDSVATDADTVYLVGARVDGIPFGARVTFAPGETLHEIEIEVASSLDDPSNVKAGALRIRLAQGCTHLRVWHTHTLHNDSDSVIHIPENARAGREPLASTRLPAGAVGFETPIGGQGLELEDGEVRFWGPVYPGTQEMEFGYGVPIEGTTTAIEVATQSGASLVRVVVPARQATPSAPGLRAMGSVSLEGRPHEAFERPALAAGETLALQLATPPLPGSDVEVARARVWLELDDVALSVNEVHRIHSAEARESSGLPLLCMPVPENAFETRFSDEARSMGLALDPSGVLSFHGPIPAGESGFAFSYQLDASQNPVAFQRRFGSDIELLELVIADTGVVPSAARLHSRRPIRNDDRNYLALEGFAIRADETVALQLTRLSGGGNMKGGTAAGLIALLSVAALGFLLAPLRSESVKAAAEPATSMERLAVYKAIDDLDEDLATGKLSPEDHGRMRGELRARAVELLREERRGPTESAPIDTPCCPSCAAEVRSADRFCAQCGEALDPRPDPGNEESAA